MSSRGGARQLSSCHFVPFFDNHARPQEVSVKPTAKDSPKHWGDDIDREKSRSLGAWQGDGAPSSKSRKEARPKISGRIEACLGQRRENGNKYGNCQADENRCQVSCRGRAVAL